MSKIPKKIVDKIEQRNKLSEEMTHGVKKILIWMECVRIVRILQIITLVMSNIQSAVKSGANNGPDIAKMIIMVIITGKRSIQGNICTWNFGFSKGCI